MNILITGGAGYIGAHTCVELLNAGHSVVSFDNYSNSHPEALSRVARITGKKPVLVKGDVRDQSALENALRDHKCGAVIHFAGLKAVGESVEKPLDYYDNNVIGTLRLLGAMQAANVKTIVFSSSATVYGDPQHLPITETHPLSATNPYGQTKLAIENMLRDHHRASPNWSIAILRYFNPVGAHESGLIGEDPRGVPQNLMPFMAQVAVGRRDKLQIFGHDYKTPDGTGVRDYIHVVDLAEGHVAALDVLGAAAAGELLTVNLGTGKGHSVLELVKAYERASGKRIPYETAARRAGDVAELYADTKLAAKLLKWKAKRDLQTMCADSWRWQSNNPDGYATVLDKKP
jgi:UDP-glucose 4-epimerase